jgi:hypothetical protein
MTSVRSRKHSKFAAEVSASRATAATPYVSFPKDIQQTDNRMILVLKTQSIWWLYVADYNGFLLRKRWLDTSIPANAESIL